MIQLSSLSAQVAVHAPLASSVSKHFAACPTLMNHCQQWIVAQWRTHYPKQTVDAGKLCLAIPQGSTDSKTQAFSGYRMVALTQVLVDRYLSEQNLALIPGFHFLTEQTGAENPQALAVDVLHIQTLINEAGPLLLEGYAQSLVQFWNGATADGTARWRWLADYLKQHLKLGVLRAAQTRQLSAAEAATAMVVVAFPQGRERAEQAAGHQVQAGLVMFDTGLDRQVSHALLIQRTPPAPAPAVQLLYSPGDGLKPFASVVAAQAWLLRQAGLEGSQTQCRQYVPMADVFDAQAQALLEETLQSIEQVGRLCQRQQLAAKRCIGGWSRPPACSPSMTRKTRPNLQPYVPVCRAGSHVRRVRRGVVTLGIWCSWPIYNWTPTARAFWTVFPISRRSPAARCKRKSTGCIRGIRSSRWMTCRFTC